MTSGFAAAIFDMDGVVTRTARLHAAAWKELFDDFLRQRAGEGTQFQPFDERSDYRAYVDGKPRREGVRSFLRARPPGCVFGGRRRSARKPQERPVRAAPRSAPSKPIWKSCSAKHSDILPHLLVLSESGSRPVSA